MAEVGKIWGKEPGDIDKIYGQDAGTLTKVLGLDFSQAAIIPAGLIVPYNGGSDPSGWSRYAVADGYRIVGAGSSYGVLSYGGSNAIASPGNLTYSGTHTSPTFLKKFGSGCYDNRQNLAGGDHTHSVNAFTYDHPYRTARLIKANSDISTGIPINGIVLGKQVFSGLTQLWNNDQRLMMSWTGVATGGSNTVAGVGTSTAGSHNHSGSVGNNCGGEYPNPGEYTHLGTLGSHSHTCSISVTPAIKRMYLTAWYNASAAFPLAGGMIAMWESMTPPADWYICNGSNGTPDLRDYFVEFGTTSNHGTTAGNNTISLSVDGDSIGHDHQGSPYSADASINAANSYTTHDHTTTPFSSIAHVPYYHALAFVMYGG